MSKVSKHCPLKHSRELLANTDCRADCAWRIGDSCAVNLIGKSALDEQIAKFEQGELAPILSAVYLDGSTFTIKADSTLTQGELTKAVQICGILNAQGAE
jgi:hypothetical protein